MKIAILGDTHFGARNDSPAFHKLFAKFYSNIFFPYLDEHHIDTIIQLGDVFDRRKYINYQSLKYSKEYFFEQANKYNTWMLVGNHDVYYKNTNDVNSLSLLLQPYNNIHQIHRPQEVEFDGTSILMVPWLNAENHQQYMVDIDTSRSQIVAGHFEIGGFEMYRGTVCDSGIDRNVFAKFEMVLSGHFHHRSHYGNIHYVGTPYEMMWSDFGDPKGFHILDTSTRELTFVTNPYVMFHKVHYDDTDKQISEVVNIDFSMYHETFVKLIVRNKTNPYCFDMFVDRLEKAGVYNVQVVDDHFHMDVANESELTSEAEDTLTILTKHIQQLDANVDKQQLTSLMISLYDEALSVE